MPDEIIPVEVVKSAEQQVVVQLFHEHPLGADAVDRLQQQGQQQLFRRDRGPTALWIRAEEGVIKPIQGLFRPSRCTCWMGWALGIRSSVERWVNRGPVHSCWPPIRSVPLGHSPTGGCVDQQHL
jgi:hypothetical protein